MTLDQKDKNRSKLRRHIIYIIWVMVLGMLGLLYLNKQVSELTTFALALLTFAGTHLWRDYGTSPTEPS
jgi:hypothetical protein